MPFQLSPSVEVQERDFTTTVPAVATSIGGIVGQFSWGPVGDIRSVHSENDLRNRFYEPNNSFYRDYFVAANFLSYSNHLKVVRVVVEPELNSGTFESPSGQNAAFNATDDSTGTFVKHEDHFEANLTTFESAEFKFIARAPGKRGNDIKVEVADETSFASSSPEWAYVDYFEYAPDTDELAVAVLLDGVVEETFVVSTVSGTKDYRGKNKYIEDVLQKNSTLVWAVGSTIESEVNASGWSGTASYSLSGGADGDAVDTGNRQTGWDEFSDSLTVDVNLLMVGAAGSDAAKYALQNVAEVRKDCVVFISPQQDSVVNSSTAVEDLITDRNLYPSSSYGFFDGNYKYQYDRYNDKHRWIPLNGDMAGLEARTDDSHDPWWASAGYNRGHVKSVTRLAFNPNLAKRDRLYKNNINPVIRESGEGTVLLGQKTMQTKPSAFDRLNVRRLFIVVEKAIANMAKYTVLFEFNDNITRQNFINAVEPYLRNVAGRRGIERFQVVCDESNNTPYVINNNGFVGDIYIDPTNVAEFIKLNFIAVKNGVDFEEVIANNTEDQ